MRNLKKFLALVLAMMMVFSLLLTADAKTTGTQYKDAEGVDTAFETAVDVLTGMGVYSGDNGNFKPAASITRAEVAALIYRLASGDTTDAQAGLYARYGNFPDVDVNAWYAGYVGYCANAGYIKGRPNGNFDPTGNVTGYEALAMILRAIGYDKNGEFTGPTWQTEVAAMAQKLGILDNVKTTVYGGTLYLAARRDVVADLLFQADANVPMVVYTSAFGYQPYGMTNPNGGTGSLVGGTTGGDVNPTLGERVFGLSYDGTGILLGNQQTGESASVMGYKGTQDKTVTGGKTPAVLPYNAYTWKTEYNVSSYVINSDATATLVDIADTTTPSNNAVLGTSKNYKMETGIELIGHKLGVWYDNGKGTSIMSSTNRVYAYFDLAKSDVVYADDINLAPTAGDGVTQLGEAIKAAGYNMNTDIAGDNIAVFSNSFGRFGSGDEFADSDAIGSGAPDKNPVAITSPVGLYKIIDNDGDKKIDAIISLNIESTQITESNNVNRVPTIGMPVTDSGTVGTGNPQPADPNKAQLETMFITTTTGGTPGSIVAGLNTHLVPATTGVLTGVVAQDAVKGSSTKELGDYVMGIHVTGTTPRTVSDNEAISIDGATTNKRSMERAYFVLNKVTAPVQGKVVAYNTDEGTVTLEDGTVLERSDYYDTVVITNPAAAAWMILDPLAVSATQAPISAIPQAWLWDNNATNDPDYTLKWVEGYANVTYKFYLDHEGKYLGAERTFGSTFLYGTYQDYSQATSTSTFNYFLTGVNLKGEIETVQLKKYWDLPTLTATTGLLDITSTENLGVPYRDSNTNFNNGLGENPYVGFAIMDETADGITTDPGVNAREYVNNMARLGVKYADDPANVAAFTGTLTINKPVDAALGATETRMGSRKYFTEGTKFILVEGFGTESVKAEVYDGISKLLGDAVQVAINMDTTPITLKKGWVGSWDANTMTYFTESDYTYAQTGSTDKKIDVIILPKEAVTWSGGSGLYYVGNPNYKMTNSWGEDAWKFDLYLDGELKQVWLNNDPTNPVYQLQKDTFYNLKDTGLKANDGQPIYTAGNYTTGFWTPYVGVTNTNPGRAWVAANQDVMTGVRYSAITQSQNSQTATFNQYNYGTKTDTISVLYNVAGAKVVNANIGAKAGGANTFTNVLKSQSGEVWPGITNLTTLNQAGSINPVTGRALRVSAVVDADDPLTVTLIYVCYDQDWVDIP